MHSLNFDPREDLLSLYRRIAEAAPGEIVLLDFPPYCVNVELLAKASDHAGDSLVPCIQVVSVFEGSRTRVEPVKPWELLQRVSARTYGM